MGWDYKKKLRDPRWQKKRLEIMQRDHFACRTCGCETDTLQIHHLKYSGDPWEVDSKDLLTVCENCHWVIEHLNIEPCKEISIKTNLTRTIFVVFTVENFLWFVKINDDNSVDKVELAPPLVRNTFHFIANFWLQSDCQHLLTDKSIKYE